MLSTDKLMATSPIACQFPLSPPDKSSPKATRFSIPPKKPSSINNKNRIDLQEAMRSLEVYSLQLRRRLDQEAFYNSLISLCISEKALEEGNRLRSRLEFIGYKPGLFLENQFLNLYSKCGEMDLARELFDEMCQKNMVSWNAMISGYCLNGCFLDALRLFGMMTEMGPKPNELTFLSTLRSSIGTGNIIHGKQIHGYALKTGVLYQIQVGNSLINMYSKYGRLRDAEIVYESMVEHDIVSWNSIIAANAQNGHEDHAVTHFIEMYNKGLIPTAYTFGSILSMEGVSGVGVIHSQIAKFGFSDHVFIGCALMDAYARDANPKDARLVFSKMSERNIVAWNTVIEVCVENDMANEGLEHFLQMGASGELPDMYTLSSLLRAATLELPIILGKQVHGLATKFGLCTDALIGNTLITMYSRHAEVFNCLRVFQNISEPDLISWNSLLQSYVQNERYYETLDVFLEMVNSGIEPDEFGFISVLVTCASLARKKTGREVHGSLIKTGMEVDNFVGSALVDMYAKTAAIVDAQRVFDIIRHKDLVTWNSMVTGLAQNGDLHQALKHLCLMLEENMEADKFTFSSILAGCADAFALQNGRQVHALILKSNFTVDTAVANALIIMYARCGSIKEAKLVFCELATKNVVSWTATIGGYAQCGNFKEAVDLFNQMEWSGVKPNDKTFVSLLTACSYAGMTNQAEKYLTEMETKYGIIPNFEHYACMVDILGRAGRLKDAEDIVSGMPYEPNDLVWRMLLSACRIYGDIDRGRRSMEKILTLKPGDSAAYVLLSNLYASLGKWDGVVEVRKLMKENGVTKEPALSWIEVQNAVHKFGARDLSHPQIYEIHSTLRKLFEEMKVVGYVSTSEFLLSL